MPLNPATFLNRMKVDTPGVYVLGSVNRHITVHSQQCRAINLIQSLIREVGLDEKSIAIVGAGFAGLTAAAYALEKSTARVTLLDAAPRPLWLQDRCKNRWLHPGIYDWPYPGSLEPCTMLPVLNWRAGSASDVAGQVCAEWERIAAKKALLTLRLKSLVKSVARDEQGQLNVTLGDGTREPFDVVILAIGFGLEEGGQGRVAYWNDADGLDYIESGANILVVGFGDGGLADVLRVCLPDIRQDSLIELVRLVPVEKQQELLTVDERLGGNSEDLNKFYSELVVPAVIDRLKTAAPSLAQVTLAGKENLYDSRSAILNRFLISQLRRARGETAFTIVKGEVDVQTLEESSDGRWKIKIPEEADKREFDQVVLRLGPQAVYNDVLPEPDLRLLNERKQAFYETPQSLDRTRVPLWENREVIDSLNSYRQDFLAYESSSRRWCLVLQPFQGNINWEFFARRALQRVAADIPNLNSEPLLLRSADAFVNPVSICSAVRALCAADIVIADVTGYDPSLMLLLGVRAAVRRGVTIACTEMITPWKDLPFNLKELNLISFADQKKGSEELQESLQAGLMQSGVSTRYLDLPVYDYIREDPSDYIAGVDNRVLLLRAFSYYGQDRILHVQDEIRRGLALPSTARVEAVIDQASPRLAGQRLYEAIRHWKNCVVDLTWWRPNVMFELGVRMAVRPSGTYCLIDETPEKEATFESTRAFLQSFLQPFSYTMQSRNFGPAFGPKTAAENPIYKTAVRHFRTMQDQYQERVDTLLIAVDPVLQGFVDPHEVVDSTPLYARDNPSYDEQIRHSIFERLCAAWYYLAEREMPQEYLPVDLLDWRKAQIFRRFRRLSAHLKDRLTYRYEPRDHRLRKNIEEAERCAQKSKAVEMAEMLDKWMEFRNNPPWQWAIDPGKLDEFQDDCDDLCQHLLALERRLNELDDPVCKLPLQEVSSDLRRLRVAMEKYKR